MRLLLKNIGRVLFNKKTLGLGVFTVLTGGILLVSDQFKSASSTMDHSGHNMSHDEMMAVDGSFNPTPVTVEVVKPKLLQASVQYTGTIEPYQVVTVYPRVAGQLTDYSIYVGDRIIAKQTLSTVSILGIIILSGIAVSSAILLLDTTWKVIDYAEFSEDIFQH